MVQTSKLESLSDPITKMWNFIDGLEDSQEYTKLLTLITSIVAVTTSLRKTFNNKQLFSILKAMSNLIKRILPTQTILKLKILLFLSKISTQFFKNIDRTENVITVICNIFYILLKDDDVIVRYLTILEFCCLKDTAQHEEIFYDSVKSDELLKNQIERIFEKEKSFKMPDKEVEKLLMNNCKFKHVCGPNIKFIEDIPSKRVRLDISDSDDLIKQILSQANSLRDKHKAVRLSEANLRSVRSVVDILKEIQ